VMSESSAASTTYIVLRRAHELDGTTDPNPAWLVVDAAVPANSAEAAIRKGAQEDGVYVAVPGRSFKPIRVEAVQVTSLKLEAAD
jgi:hypothetical protein